MPNTTTSDINAVNDFYDRDLLFRAQPMLLHNMFGQTRNIPQKNSGTIKFRRYVDLSLAKTPLSEGITKSGSKLSKTDLQANIDYYGDYVTLTDELTLEIEDPVRMETNELLGDQAGKTIDSLTADELSSGTNVIYSGTGNTARSQVSSGDTIDSSDVDAAEQLLKNNNTMMVTEQIDPTTGIATEPVASAFIGICHTNISPTIRGFSTFTRVEKYSNPNQKMKGEIGKYQNVRFLETTQATVFTGEGNGGVDVYSTIIFGKRAFATTRIAGAAMQNIVKPLGSGGTSDPLDQRETSGWKSSFVAKILNNNFIVRIEHTQS